MRIAMLAVLAMMSSCAMGDRHDSGEARLAAELAGRSAGEARACVNTARRDGLRVIDEQTLLYREGQTLWVNRLPSSCPSLHPASTLIVEIRGGRYCNGDLVRALEPGSSILGPACSLGDFMPYTRR